ncbi:MAG TPA: 6-phospho-beta-glucosidase [Nocardioidaceae bacterium]|nr:6-phospho-beta-glucosidase [Nocardioidaceae bacterium]
MKLTILGGGGFRVPLVYRALLGADSVVSDLVLYDVDRARLDSIAAVLEQVQRRDGRPGPRLTLTSDLTEAVGGADFVFSAIRVGGLVGRVCDERIALANGVLGQETTGAGGVCYGLRTVPVALEIASVVAKHAPGAYLINFTNPAGMVTEAMSRVLGDRAIGICDSPVGLFKRVARGLDVDVADAHFEYAGLNHLGWLRRVVVDGRDRLPELLADRARLLTVEEGRLFGPDWLETLGSVPNEYLWYWYFNADAVAAAQSAEQTRGEYLVSQQVGFYASVGDDPYDAWDRTRRAREESYMADSRESSGAGERDADDLDGGGYDKVALQLMHAIAGNEPTQLVLNVANRATLTGLDSEAVVEVPCAVDASGARPLPVEPLEAYQQGVVTSVKDVERTTIEAATAGSMRLAVRALALHPLVDSVTRARAILDAQVEQVPALAHVLRG